MELYRYLVRLTGDVDLAADAAQESFVRLLHRPQLLAELVTADARRGWLYRVATNVALDETRTAGRRRRILAMSPERAPLADPAPQADALVEAREREAQATTALATLAPRERTALLMREAGFAHREIAEAVNTTTGSVGTIIARALAKLTGALGASKEGG